ncbi:DEAD domain-containing protein/Helicase_C domain-containing protein/HA2 domain-containing protein/OB_NTP_bind domain-containing protein [Cephalotus follicularis]|uniref:RNA helicase n=1 Tax=Cephalotus follicularis TaxID=3775 RepID=A0A1Q3CPS8_CEPFO|nr:DEAD domain-containing protein/Helicase_C domain-containing protein/HA2 domain-containing protein/OB_NTP_bind domain-containing protein [Cephalotus follicularis]
MDVFDEYLGQEEGGSYNLESGESNALILPAKKSNKRKGIPQQSENVTTKSPKLSKSQKRKLKKLEEEKEKALLLAKSIETLEKYKIPKDALALLHSVTSIGRAETKLEKRRWAMQFSKAGLEVPQVDQPVKRRAGESASFETEPESDQIDSGQEVNENYFMEPVKVDREVVDKNNSSVEPTFADVQGLDATSVADLPAEDVCDLDFSRSKQEDDKNSTPTSFVPDSMKSGEAMRSITAPTIVHVSRPREVENKRKDLPIVMMEQEIMEAINDHPTVIICGETGCGKTTQVPQFLYEAGFGSKKSHARSGIIGVTQPRRVAVLATAKRVAYELGLRLGKEVGFQVRHDKRIGENCSIKFMTDGILLREVQNDMSLKRYSIVILDEAHERSLNTDILIGMLSRIIQLRQDLYEEQRGKLLSGECISPENLIFPLKLVLMSATLRVEDFISGRRLFCNPPVIEVPTRQFPVTLHFLKRTEIVDYIGQAYKKVMSIHRSLPQGGILVFVTGQREVEYLCQKLCKASRELVVNASKLNVGSEVTSSLSEMNSIEGTNMEEIDEALEILGHSTFERTDRFSSYDEDQCDIDMDESDTSYNSDTESDMEIIGNDRNLLNQRIVEEDGSLGGVLGEEGSLTSLKAAFEALAGKPASDSVSETKELTPVTPKGFSEQSNLVTVEKGGEDKGSFAGAMQVLPLYAMLPAAAQLRVFEEVREGERLVVIATNVAETSLTIPGIKYVVDTGREKVKNYNSSNGMETYEVQWISKASAAQRAGRAGRTGPGHCYRLYSSAVFNNILPDFSFPEISKIPVEGVVLLMKSMGIDKVTNFPFPTPPEATAMVEAVRCLKALEALDGNGRLTPLGKAMAYYPMSPRHSRMLLTVIQIMKKVTSYARANLVLGYAVAAAAALSLSNPFVMQFEGSHPSNDGVERDERSGTLNSVKTMDKQEKLRKNKLKETSKMSRAKFSNPSSDALTIARALQCFELSASSVEFCNENALHLKTMEEMSKLRKQLLQLVFHQTINCGFEQDFSWTHGTLEDVEQAWRVSSSKNTLLLNEEDLLGQALCAGWADRVAKRCRNTAVSSDADRKATSVRYQTCMVKESVFLHRWSSVSYSAPEFLVYSELLCTKRPYMLGATSVKSEWLVKYAGSFCTFSAPLTDPKPHYDPQSDQVFCWVVPTFGPHLWQLPLHSLPINDFVHRVAVFAYALLEGHVLPCLSSVRKYMAAPPSNLLRPEAAGQRRVGNLLHKLKARSIDTCAILRKTWMENPNMLHSEILDWFQESFHKQYEELWSQMHREALLEPHERFPMKVKRDKRKK